MEDDSICSLVLHHNAPKFLVHIRDGCLRKAAGSSSPGARFNKEVQPTLNLNLNSELSYSEMGNSEFSVTEQLNCVSLLNSK